MSRAQVQAVSVLEDSRLDAGGVLCPEAHDWIAGVVTADDVIEALRRRPEVGRALAARLVIAGPWREHRPGSSLRDALWPSRRPWPSFFAFARRTGGSQVRASVHSVTEQVLARASFASEQQAHQWCDEQLLARGVVLLDELPGGGE